MDQAEDVPAAPAALPDPLDRPLGRSLSILVHGPSKAGKSTLGVTTPAPRLLLDVEGGARLVNKRRLVDAAAAPPRSAHGSKAHRAQRNARSRTAGRHPARHRGARGRQRRGSRVSARDCGRTLCCRRSFALRGCCAVRPRFGARRRSRPRSQRGGASCVCCTGHREACRLCRRVGSASLTS